MAADAAEVVLALISGVVTEEQARGRMVDMGKMMAAEAAGPGTMAAGLCSYI